MKNYYSKTLHEFVRTWPRFRRQLASPHDKIEHVNVNRGSIIDYVEVFNRYNDYLRSVFKPPEFAITNSSTGSNNELTVMPDVVLSEEGVFSLPPEIYTKQ